jgi:hypothetical protein
MHEQCSSNPASSSQNLYIGIVQLALLACAMTLPSPAKERACTTCFLALIHPHT